jgi:site-specific DNA-adenine methylase
MAILDPNGFSTGKRMRYPGGKNGAGIPQWFCGMMPIHDVYAEPFAGSAAVARFKIPAATTIVIDRSSTAPAMLRDSSN